MRLIDADKLHPDSIGRKGLAISQSQIAEAPTVEPFEKIGAICNENCGYRLQDKWIPVGKRLPEDMQKVLVWFEYYRYGDYNCMYQTYGFGYVCDGKWSPFINGETGWQDARIIAWMSLPEAYKEVENER